MNKILALMAALALALVYAGLWRAADPVEIQSMTKLPISPQMWKWINETPSFNH